MGHNRAGDRRKKRIRRNKRQNKKLYVWNKSVVASLTETKDYIWAFLSGDDIYFAPHEPAKFFKMFLALPKSQVVGVPVTHPNKLEVQNFIQETYELLDEIGLPYKTVSEIKWATNVGTAHWLGDEGVEDTGTITIFRSCEAGAVAHELGHGFHEAINFNKKNDLTYPFRWGEDGEAFAEAIRFFVSQKMQNPWVPQTNRYILDYCSWDFQFFKNKVKALLQ